MFVTLGEGVVFGEISILNIPGRCSSSLTTYFVICCFTTLFFQQNGQSKDSKCSKCWLLRSFLAKQGELMNVAASFR